jgi:hypothetical protein
MLLVPLGENSLLSYPPEKKMATRLFFPITQNECTLMNTALSMGRSHGDCDRIRRSVVS